MKFLKIERVLMSIMLLVIAFGIFSVVSNEMNKTEKMRIFNGEFDKKCAYTQVTNVILDTSERDSAGLTETHVYSVYDMDKVIGHIAFTYQVSNDRIDKDSETVSCLP